jgi:hypothetical protein
MSINGNGGAPPSSDLSPPLPAAAPAMQPNVYVARFDQVSIPAKPGRGRDRRFMARSWRGTRREQSPRIFPA